MESVNRLVWAAGLSFGFLGFEAGLRVNEPSVLERLLPCLPTGWEPRELELVDRLYSVRIPAPDPTRGRRHYNLCYADHILVARSLSLEDTLSTFRARVAEDLAEGATERLLVSASVVTLGAEAILLAGPVRSSLLAPLAQAGGRLLSEQFAVLDEGGRVHPYPARPGARPRKVTRVLLLRAGASWRARALARARGVLELVPCTPSSRGRPERALRILSRALDSALVWKATCPGGLVEPILRSLSAGSVRAPAGK
ncbi:hypothetical protein DYH09_30305 [bacterium CPR1]|nr:hypothetical protein [bacterium CPR1]